jgi:hypothetical protein
MANQIIATVYQIDGSPLASPIEVSFLTSDIMIKEAVVGTIPSVNSAIFYYPNTNNKLQDQVFFVSETLSALLTASNAGNATQVQATVLEINNDPQIPGGVQYTFPVYNIAIWEVTPVLNGVNSYIQYKNKTYSVSETIASLVAASNITSPVEVTLPAVQSDAFGRLRVSNPLTLFDSSHRYDDNELWSTATATGGAAVFNADQGLVDINVTAASGSSVIRETIKVFSYQPGKSLLVMNTFVMNDSKTGLTQRVGYYGDDNGFYLQQEGDDIAFVERSIVTGSLVENSILQADWNGDKLDGTGASGYTLDLTKAQIYWMDVEWLGVGSVRMGFVIDGQFIICHTFNHANLITSTYITTASLPLRYEIFNTAGTSGASTLKQICSTVISEGGYELRGKQQSAGTAITAPRTFAVAGTYYPIVGIRLKSTRLDAIAIATAVSILGLGNSKNYEWRVVNGSTALITGGSWVDASADSSVQYNITGSSVAGGRVLASGYVNSSNQGSPSINILKEALFANQLERNGLTGTPFELVIAMAVATTSGGESAYASIDWEEISR